MTDHRDRDSAGRARQARPRDELGRPLAYGSPAAPAVSDEALGPDETVRTGQRLLDEGRPFSAHEVFEARWKAGPDAERDLWQGLAQLAVAVTHALRGNATGARRLLARGDDRVRRYAEAGGPAYGLDLDQVRAQAVQRVTAALESS